MFAHHIDKSFDKNFGDFFYLPWIGKDYLRSNSRILIVGESLYNWEESDNLRERADEQLNNKNFVRTNLKQHGYPETLDYEMKKGKFYRNVESTFLGAQPTKAAIHSFWERVAFHQFVQRPLKNIRERPIKEDYIIGARVLKELIEAIEAEYVIFLGSDYNKLKAIQDQVKGTFFNNDPKVGRYQPRRIEFSLENHQVKIIAIKHPSSHYSLDGWANYLRLHMPLPTTE